MQLFKVVTSLIVSFSSLAAARGDFSKSCNVKTLQIKGDRWSYDGFELQAQCGKTTARLPLNYCIGFDGEKLFYASNGFPMLSSFCSECMMHAGTAMVHCLCTKIDKDGKPKRVFPGYDLDNIVVNHHNMLECNGQQGHTH